ncbi:tRNA-splicing endonuclease subunit sen54 [Tulasnella sp. 419]|nr:tRNA-splicing endonuclease subunit sen54 [Tulasnella sp. 419]
MDDSLENPVPSQPPKPEDLGGEDDLSGDEEDVADWTKFSSIKFTLDKPIIPKRGEKDFEPTGGPSLHATGSNLQSHALNRARDAMYSALQVERGISSKSISYGLWFPKTAHAELTLARGTLWTSMGYSNYRVLPVSGSNEKDKDRSRRVELLPEEALYMIERGSIYCWKVDGQDQRTKEDVYSTARGETSLEDVYGSPMSVQQAYAEMLGLNTGVTSEQYQVYAYLKRLGYVVIRAQKPSGIPSYPVAPPPDLSENATAVSLFARLCHAVTSVLSRLISPLYRREWWKPVGLRNLNWWTMLTPGK